MARNRSSIRFGAAANRAPLRGSLPVNELWAAAGVAGSTTDTPIAMPTTASQVRATRATLPPMSPSAKVRSAH